MSRRALFGSSIGQVLRQPFKTVDQLAKVLNDYFNDSSPIELSDTVELKTNGDNPAIRILDTSATAVSTIKLERSQSNTGDRTQQVTTLSSAGLQNDFGNGSTRVTSSPTYADLNPSADRDVQGVGNKSIDRYVTAVDKDGNIVTVGGVGGPGGFDDFGLSRGVAAVVELPFKLTGDLTAGKTNHAEGKLQFWDENAGDWADTVPLHKFDIYGDFIKTDRTTDDLVFAKYGRVPKRFFAV